MTKPASHLAHYQAVQWRGTTPVSDGWICFSFTRDAEVLRIRLPVESAHGLVDAAAAYLGRCGVQSPRSSGMPSPLGSPKLGQKVYPLASSSAAGCGLAYEPRESPSNTMCQRMSCCMAIQKVPCRVLWLYATGLMLLSFLMGVGAGVAKHDWLGAEKSCLDAHGQFSAVPQISQEATHG